MDFSSPFLAGAEAIEMINVALVTETGKSDLSDSPTSSLDKRKITTRTKEKRKR